MISKFATNLFLLIAAIYVYLGDHLSAEVDAVPPQVLTAIKSEFKDEESRGPIWNCSDEYKGIAGFKFYSCDSTISVPLNKKKSVLVVVRENNEKNLRTLRCPGSPSGDLNFVLADVKAGDFNRPEFIEDVCQLIVEVMAGRKFVILDRGGIERKRIFSGRDVSIQATISPPVVKIEDGKDRRSVIFFTANASFEVHRHVASFNLSATKCELLDFNTSLVGHFSEDK